jgi:hypothetical protein
VAGELALPAFVRRHDVLERRLPVRVEHDHGVGFQPVEVLLLDAVQPGTRVISLPSLISSRTSSAA